MYIIIDSQGAFRGKFDTEAKAIAKLESLIIPRSGSEPIAAKDLQVFKVEKELEVLNMTMLGAKGEKDGKSKRLL